MQLLLIAVFSTIFLFYILAIILLYIGIARIQQFSQPKSDALPSVSIIIAAKNEAHNLPRLIQCLTNQQYPEDRLEICIVDDHSQDESWDILCCAKEKYSNFYVIKITDSIPDFAPKKRALDLGIRATTGDILLFTDADCTPPPTWVKSTVECYGENTSVVVGYSPYRFDKPINSMIRGLLALEFFSVAAVAAGSIGIKRPLTAAGCNLSYRRSTYFAMGGFESIRKWVSGDDDLFILKVAQKKPGTITYALSPQAFVPGAAPLTWNKFRNQRIRYASKGMHYELPMTIGLISVYFLNAFLFFGLLSLFVFPGIYGLTAVIAWVIKAIFEFIFLLKASKAFQIKRLLRYFIITQVLHPPYLLFFGFLGLFNRFQWKDQAFLKTTETIRDNIVDSR